MTAHCIGHGYSRVRLFVPLTHTLRSAMRSVALLSTLERGSRGQYDLAYSQALRKKILITGFDPFLLDEHIDQSNPSGVAALLLDGQVLSHQGIRAEINTVMIPVRYKDFDEGLIESLLAPYYALNNVDMVVTISMGREHFDLERFPGKRRSVTAPDNANIVYGGTQTAPKISSLNGRPLPGAEFVEFSLPVAHMQKAQGPYEINDNHEVTTLEKTFKPSSLAELEGAIAVNGGGGGITYRMKSLTAVFACATSLIQMYLQDIFTPLALRSLSHKRKRKS